MGNEKRMRSILAADLGASSLRVALIDETGRLHALLSRPLETVSPAPDQREQDPRQWWHLFTELTAALLKDSPKVPAAIVITGGTRSQVLVDKQGEPLRPAIMWDDSRAVQQAGRLAATFNQDRNLITAFHPAARLAWLAEHEASAIASVGAVLQPKDFIIHRLTGERCSDSVSNWMLLDEHGHYRESLILATGFAQDRLPRLAEPEQQIGRVMRQTDLPASLAGIPVFCGSMDTWCCALALGAYQAGASYAVSGTSEVIGVIHGQRLLAKGLLTLPWGKNQGETLWHMGGPSQCGGRTVSWARSILGLNEGELDELIQPAPLTASAPLFIPYLDGERTPHWNPDLRGSWHDLHMAHHSTDLLRAVIEGIAFHSRTILTAAHAGDEPATPLVIGGGLARSDRWCQLRADILQRPVTRTTAEEPGLHGAAMLAMTGLGWYISLDEARRQLAATATTFEPATADADLIDERYQRFCRYLAWQQQAAV